LQLVRQREAAAVVVVVAAAVWIDIEYKECLHLI
jgi:hypothetical protein